MTLACISLHAFPPRLSALHQPWAALALAPAPALGSLHGHGALVRQTTPQFASPTGGLACSRRTEYSPSKPTPRQATAWAHGAPNFLESPLL